MVEEISQAQKQRLTFIDFSLQYFGHITRADLIYRFRMGTAAATRDFASYRALAPDNLQLIHQVKQYQRTEQFKPLFFHDAESVLIGLSRGFGDGLSFTVEPSDHCLDAIRLIHPKTDIIATLMRAIVQKKAIECQYISLSSGANKRILVPHVLVNNGHRWHVRAFDHKSQQFRDFVCTRFTKLNIIHDKYEPQSLSDKSKDKQWQRIVDLTLIPHPNVIHKEAIELDYDMTNGVITLEVRAALVGYLLQQWQVDSSKKHGLMGSQYQLALENPASLYGVENLMLAPGYETSGETQNKKKGEFNG
ncbi:MAG: WYL domain-containing protein [Alteromonadaceae bacterium]|nr:WYL domain-containing protein [Alteromonadaceae bacterium]